jgi:predicted metal-dependent phosphoesterase TrpH
MEYYVDLHLHSRHSDGVHTPEELVRIASGKGLRAIAIADHDSIDGIDSALEEGARLGVEVLPAVELSVSYSSLRDVHLLGYLIDHHDQPFVSRLDGLRRSREERVEAILAKINGRLTGERREPISYGEVLEQAGGAVGRPHIARVLMGRGYCRDMDEAFDRYLEPCNVPKPRFPIADAIKEIKRAGGLAVLAHPTSMTSNLVAVGNLIREYRTMGLDGLEVYSNMCYKDDIIFIKNLARQMGLLVTGGSDYHGHRPDEELGELRGGTKIPYLVVEKLKEARHGNGTNSGFTPTTSRGV